MYHKLPIIAKRPSAHAKFFADWGGASLTDKSDGGMAELPPSLDPPLTQPSLSIIIIIISRFIVQCDTANNKTNRAKQC